MITVAEYNHPEQLEPLSELWDRFFAQTPDACFSHSRDWVAGLDTTAGKPRVLLALVGGRPFGLWALQVETRTSAVGPLRVLTSAGSGFCPFSGPVGPYTTAMLTAAMRHLRRTRRDWDMVEFDLWNPTKMQKQRLDNSFRLLKWRCQAEPSAEWVEVVSPADRPVRWETPSSVFTMERVRAEDLPSAPWSVLASCLSLVEEFKGAEAARQLRAWHQAGYRAGLTDWSLLRENGTPQAAALLLRTRGRWLCTALVGRSETARSALVRRLLEEARWEGDLPFLFRSGELPFAASWWNATPRGFRYTHVSPWALKARWLRLRQRIQSRWARSRTDEPAANRPESSPTPPRPKLTMYRPPAESLNV